jgi:peroxiredoxin Q/BCP
MLKVGAKAPAFRLRSDEGQEIALKDFAGRRVLLFFFPKASTPG